MNSRFRNVIILAVLLVGVAVFVLTRSSGQSPAGAANALVQEASTVERGDVALTVSATGPLQAIQKVSLSFSTNGTVASVNVSEGDHVRKGQTIATLDTQALTDSLLLAEARVLSQQMALRQLTDKPRNVDIAEKKAAHNTANAQLYEARHTGVDPLQIQINKMSLENAKNQLWQSELTRDANNQLKDKLNSNPLTKAQAATLPNDTQNDASITAQDYNVKIAQANLDASQSKGGSVGSIASGNAAVTRAQVELDNLCDGGDDDQVAQATAQVQQAQAAVDLARANLARGTLLAPFDGVVAQLNLHVGEHTPAGAAAIMLDTHSFYVDISVDETDVSKLALDQPTTLTLDALPGVSVFGKVTRIAQTGSKSGSVVTYPVRVEIDPAGQPLLSSMSVTANITTSIVKDVIRVRNRFVRLDRSTGKASVNVKQPDGTYKSVEVVLGLRNDTYTEIKSGLNVGDSIAILQNNTLSFN